MKKILFTLFFSASLQAGSLVNTDLLKKYFDIATHAQALGIPLQHHLPHPVYTSLYFLGELNNPAFAEQLATKFNLKKPTQEEVDHILYDTSFIAHNPKMLSKIRRYGYKTNAFFENYVSLILDKEEILPSLEKEDLERLMKDPYLLDQALHVNVDMVGYLKSLGISVDTPWFDDITPLHIAVELGLDQVVRSLVSHGASTTAITAGEQELNACDIAHQVLEQAHKAKKSLEEIQRRNAIKDLVCYQKPIPIRRLTIKDDQELIALPSEIPMLQ